jgi:hypothetical protein
MSSQRGPKIAADMAKQVYFFCLINALWVATEPPSRMKSSKRHSYATI